MYRNHLKKVLRVLVTVVLVGCGSSKQAFSPVITEKKAASDIEIITSTEVVTPKPKKVNPNANPLTQAYVDAYAPLAMDEMKKFGIPASITLAQGILESGNGVSELAGKSNNHFGIKCHKQWTGPRVYHDDDEKGECFRKYKHPATSYQDHSLFLTSRSRYASLFDLKKDDYKNWAYGLKKAGYATDPRYPKKLIGYIETYDLAEYDKIVLKGEKYASFDKAKSDKIALSVVVNEDVSTGSFDGYKVKKGDTLYGLSRKFGVTVAKLKQLNGLSSNNLALGQVLRVTSSVVKKDSPSVKSVSNTYQVQAKDTLYGLSRKFGLSVEELKRINKLSSNSLSIGQILKIR